MCEGLEKSRETVKETMKTKEANCELKAQCQS